MTVIEKFIQYNIWSISEGFSSEMPFIIRFRTPVLEPKEVGEYTSLLTVVWPYAEEDSGEMPTETESKEMEIFEDRLLKAWESDATAVLTAVFTFDGARQWVFYTRDRNRCTLLLHQMPQEEEPYPIELETEEDPEWEYLRNELMLNVSYCQYQKEWQKNFSSL